MLIAGPEAIRSAREVAARGAKSREMTSNLNFKFEIVASFVETEKAPLN